MIETSADVVAWLDRMDPWTREGRLAISLASGLRAAAIDDRPQWHLPISASRAEVIDWLYRASNTGPYTSPSWTRCFGEEVAALLYFEAEEQAIGDWIDATFDLVQKFTDIRRRRAL